MPQAEEGPSPAQARVLAELLQGESITEAARKGSVDRSTVHRWLNEDSRFKASYNRQLAELRAESEMSLALVVGRALEVVASAVALGDTRVALAVLKGSGALAMPVQVGPTTEDGVRQAKAFAELFDVFVGVPTK